MKNIIKTAISVGGFDLNEMLRKIDVMWAEAKLNDAEREELRQLARDKANPADSLAPLMERVAALELKVAALETADDPEEPTEDYPEWVQPTGAHDAYNTGDRVTFKGAVYESTIDNNVWSPEVNPSGWRAVSE